MSRPYSRTPKYYDGTETTSKQINQLLAGVLSRIGDLDHQQGELILAMWPDLVGPSLAPMTQAISFSEGILLVKVKNSTLHSLLSHNEKPRLLRLLREKFPKVVIKTIYFRMG